MCTTNWEKQNIGTLRIHTYKPSLHKQKNNKKTQAKVTSLHNLFAHLQCRVCKTTFATSPADICLQISVITMRSCKTTSCKHTSNFANLHTNMKRVQVKFCKRCTPSLQYTQPRFCVRKCASTKLQTSDKTTTFKFSKKTLLRVRLRVKKKLNPCKTT